MKLQNTWVFAESPLAISQFCNEAQKISDQVSVLLVGGKTEAERALGFGANKVYWLGERDESSLLEDFAETIYDLLLNEKPELLIVQSTKRGKLIAGTLAAKLGTSALTDIVKISVGESVQATHMIYGGAAMRTERIDSDIAIVTANEGLFEPSEEDKGQQGKIIPVELSPFDRTIELVEKRAKKTVEVNLPAAKRVIGVGRGFTAREDLGMAETLSELLGAEIGCTRPLSEGVDWLPAERYIGVSGVMLKPDIYFALGVSGQIQHMVGVNQARVVIAVNKDTAAPIFRQADLCIAGDLNKILPKLISKIKAT